MDTEKQLFQRYENTEILVDAVQKTIENPDKSVADILAEGDKRSRQMSAILASSGAAISASALAAISAEAGVVGGLSIVGGMGLTAGTVAGILGGPLVWGSGLIVLLVMWIRNRRKKRSNRSEKPKKEKKVKGQKAFEEKISLLKKIIQKQQALLDALSKEDQKNKERIRNLEEALRMMKEAHESVSNDFAVA